MSEGVHPGLLATPRWTTLVAAWGCVALMLLVQMAAQLDPLAPPIEKAWALLQQLMRAVYWGLLTPFIFRLLARWPLSGPGRFGHLLLHFGMAWLLAAVFFAARVPAFHAIYDIPDHQRDFVFLAARASVRNVVDPILYFSVVVAGTIQQVYEDLRRRELSEVQLQQQLAEAELQALKQQVQPHFLFNALNAVAMLVRAGRQEEAVRMLSQLGGLHRRIVDAAGRQTAPLEEEFAFVADYLAIEHTRFGDRLRVETVLPDDCRRAEVPCLLLQPLVENAVKHGVARHEQGGRVRLAARRAGDRLQIEVANDLPGADRLPPSPGTGSGLPLTRRRLERLHGLRADCRIVRSNREFRVCLELPFQPVPSAP